jgi:flagellin-like protein
LTFIKAEEREAMHGMIIIAGFIVLIVGGLVYTLVPYTSNMSYKMQTEDHISEYTTTTTTTGNSPLGTVVMFIGFTIVVVGLFYKPQKAEAPKIM